MAIFVSTVVLADVSSTRPDMVEFWRSIDCLERRNDVPKDGRNYDDDHDDEDGKDDEVYRGQ